MNIIQCPKCGREDFVILKKEGSLFDGVVIEVLECLDCHEVYDVVAEISEIKIEESLHMNKE